MKLEEIKIKAIENALISAGENKAEAARNLGVSIRALRYWIDQYQELSRFRRSTPIQRGGGIRREVCFL
jgi:transposase-like protein